MYKKPPTIPQLAEQVIREHDWDAGAELARKLLDENPPPVSFSDYMSRIPDLPHPLSVGAFNVLSDTFDFVRQERIEKIPNPPKEEVKQ